MGTTSGHIVLTRWKVLLFGCWSLFVIDLPHKFSYSTSCGEIVLGTFLYMGFKNCTSCRFEQGFQENVE